MEYLFAFLLENHEKGMFKGPDKMKLNFRINYDQA